MLLAGNEYPLQLDVWLKHSICLNLEFIQSRLESWQTLAFRSRQSVSIPLMRRKVARQNLARAMLQINGYHDTQTDT